MKKSEEKIKEAIYFINNQIDHKQSEADKYMSFDFQNSVMAQSHTNSANTLKLEILILKSIIGILK